VTFGILYSGRFTGSGAMSIAESAGVSLEPTLRGRGKRRNIQVEIEHRAYTVCDYRTWMNGGRQCSNYVVPSWSGGFRDTAAKYRGCHSLPVEYQQWRRVSKSVGWSVTKDQGRGFTSGWSLGTAGGSVGSKTNFSETNTQRWSVPDGRHTKVAQTCIGGVDGTWKSASEVVTQSKMPERPCNPPEPAHDPNKC
jgi:hypothetical protein